MINIKQILIFLALLILSVILATKVPVQQELAPDPTLYIGLAKNLAAGKGYYDTIRDDEILPSIGHPMLLSLSLRLNASSYFDETLVFLSFIFIALAIWRYTGKFWLAVIAEILMFSILQEIGFYKFGIETSGISTASMLLCSLVYLYRGKSKIWWSVAFAATALTLNILVRPTLLYIGIAISVVLFVYALTRHKEIFQKYQLMRYKLLISTTITLFLIFLTYLISIGTYGDGRMIRGTYAAMNLYVANNEYVPADKTYSSKLLNDLPSEEKTNLINSAGWQNREKLLLNKTLEYIQSNPKRALEGWIWRLKKYLGNDYQPENSLYSYKIQARLVIFLLVLQIAIFYLLRKNLCGKNTYLLSTGIAFLLLFQIFQLVFFAWSGKRYLTYLVPFLVTAFALLVNDSWVLIHKFIRLKN